MNKSVTTIKLTKETVKRLGDFKDRFGFSSYDYLINSLLNNSERLKLIFVEEGSIKEVEGNGE